MTASPSSSARSPRNWRERQEGRRVRIVARLAGQELVTFHLDLSSGDALVHEPDILNGSDLLQGVGFPLVTFPAYPIVQHLAEKLHAYTLPRERENTRVRDLVDLALIATVETVRADWLDHSVQATFTMRGTHAVPTRLPEPPASWAQPFAILAVEAAHPPIVQLRDGYALAARFCDPFLADRGLEQTWMPSQGEWSAAPRPFREPSAL